MTVAKQLVLTLVREITAQKKSRRVFPDSAMRIEVLNLVGQVLDALVADGSLVCHSLSVNRHIAYAEPQQDR